MFNVVYAGDTGVGSFALFARRVNHANFIRTGG